MSIPDHSPQLSAEPNMVNIEGMRNHSELFRAECLRLISDTDKQCKHMQTEDQKLGESKRNQLVLWAQKLCYKPQRGELLFFVIFFFFFCCLDQRIKDIEYLKKELGLNLKLITEETDELIALQSRVVKALEASKEPLRVSVLCLEERLGWREWWKKECEKEHSFQSPLNVENFLSLPSTRSSQLWSTLR